MTDWHKEFVQLTSEEIKPVEIVSDATIASVGIGDGRNIPLIILDCEERIDITNLFQNHKLNVNGEINTRWIKTSKNKNMIGILFHFIVPINCKFYVEFDIRKSGALINLIVKAQSLYIQCGKNGDRLSSNFNGDRIIVEIQSEDFREEWNNIYMNQMIKHLRKKHKISQKKAQKIAKEIIDEFKIVDDLRMR